jgi:iron complex transport system substrate-binding protein
MKRLLVLLVAVAATALPAGAGAGSGSPPARPAADEKRPVLPARVRDQGGRTVVVRNVSRIVSLNGDVTETIFALGLGANLVGVDTSAIYPPRRVAGIPKIGYQRELNAEWILALRPTLVIGSAEAGPPAVLEQLRSAGVTVAILRANDALGAGPWKLREVGKALGVPKRGERLARQVARQIAVAGREATSARTHPRVAFLYLRGPRTQLIGGTKTRAHSMIVAAGGINAGAQAGIEGYRPITAEALVAARPDVLLVLSDGLASVGGVDGLVRIPGVAQTPAGANRRVLAYDDLLMLGLGPRTGGMLRRLVRDFHPELRSRG